jgi:hypothetical protein
LVKEAVPLKFVVGVGPVESVCGTCANGCTADQVVQYVYVFVWSASAAVEICMRSVEVFAPSCLVCTTEQLTVYLTAHQTRVRRSCLGCVSADEVPNRVLLSVVRVVGMLVSLFSKYAMSDVCRELRDVLFVLPSVVVGNSRCHKMREDMRVLSDFVRVVTVSVRWWPALRGV